MNPATNPAVPIEPRALEAQVEAELAPVIAQLEAERRRLVRGTTIVAIVVGAIVLAICLSELRSTEPNPLPGRGDPGRSMVFAMFIGFAIVLAFYSSRERGYRSRFKSQVITHLIRALHPGLSYAPEDSVSQREFEESTIWTRDVDRFSGEDLVEGQIGATRLRFSELHAEYEKRGARGQTHWHTIFQGLFFIADFNKHFVGATVVLPDTAERLFGRFGRTLQSLSGRGGSWKRELISLEDPEFERAFVVYSSDQIQARYILSTSLMRRLLEFRGRTGGELYVAFVHSQVYVAIAGRRDLFEPPVFERALSLDLLHEYAAQLRFVLDIVHELNLNTRIWSKT